MKLTYKILWLDDKIDEFIEDEIISEIEKFLLDNGFKPEVTPLDSTKDFLEAVNDTYDLILTDYHLNDINGHDIIKTIRGQDYSIMSEILFYTAQADLVDTDRINRVSFLETNTLLGDHKELVLQAVKSLIGLTIKKFQHIVAMRGMIMHETSSLDLQMAYIVREQLKNPDLKDAIEPVLKSIFDEILKNAEEKYIRAQSRKAKEILRDNVLFNSSQKIYALGQILNIINEPDFSEDYSNEIILIRNQFAHSELTINSEGKEVFQVKGEELVFDEELCKKIRVDINKHKTNLDRLIEQLKK